jgi:hypothetical protein
VRIRASPVGSTRPFDAKPRSMLRVGGTVPRPWSKSFFGLAPVGHRARPPRPSDIGVSAGFVVGAIEMEGTTATGRRARGRPGSRPLPPGATGRRAGRDDLHSHSEAAIPPARGRAPRRMYIFVPDSREECRNRPEFGGLRGFASTPWPNGEQRDSKKRHRHLGAGHAGGSRRVRGGLIDLPCRVPGDACARRRLAALLSGRVGPEAPWSRGQALFDGPRRRPSASAPRARSPESIGALAGR